MDNSLWMAKGAERGPTFDNPSRIETKRTHRWLADSGEADFFSSKKHAVQSPSAQSISRISHSNIPAWESLASFQPTSNQFVDRLFGSETTRPVDFTERSISLVEAGGANLSEKDSEDQYEDDISVGCPYLNPRRTQRCVSATMELEKLRPIGLRILKLESTA